MQKTIIGAAPNGITRVDVDGEFYEIKVEEYTNVGGYARVLIRDCKTGDYYFSDGYLELNNHIFKTEWKKEYEPYRDNWICSDDLLITID